MKFIISEEQHNKLLSIAQKYVDGYNFDEVSHIDVLPPGDGFSQPRVVIYFMVDEGRKYLTSRMEDIMNEIWLDLYNLMGMTVQLHSKLMTKPELSYTSKRK